MKNYDSIKHVRGESLFLDDQLTPTGTLFGYVSFSPIAHGRIKKIDLSNAEKLPGVKAIITAKDIPGENQIGGIIQDEDLFAENEVNFVGHPIALVVAETQLIAHAAADLIKYEFKKLPVITDPRKAAALGELIQKPRTFNLGNTEKAFDKCEFVFKGKVESGGQEHLYLETQGAFAHPVEGGGVKIFSSTQGPTAVQRVTSRVLEIPMHKIEVDVLRLGGGFGGKEDQASPWGAMAALAAFKLNTPVKLVLPRQVDIKITGKRHPYSSDFKIGLNKEGKILAYEVSFYQNAGAAADLSTAVLERTLFHSTNSYFIPNVKATSYCCKTNLPPNTAFRGFGGPQGMFVIESAISKAAEEMGINKIELQKKNLLSEGDEFPYGQKVEHCRIKKCFNEAEKKYNIKKIKKGVNNFNSKNKLFKKGLAVMPVTFGISFTSTFMNQASALVHIYTDGSISVSTAAVEMGQGVNAKIRNVVQNVFSVNLERIKIETTNTSRVANTSPTAASKAADLNGFAAKKACDIILGRLKKVAAKELNIKQYKNTTRQQYEDITIQQEFIYNKGKKTKLDFNKLIQIAYLNRISLSAQAHHSTPNIHFDKLKEKGQPFAYHSYGVGIVEATVDCIRGTYEIDSVKVVHDFGKSLHPIVDKGQAEGGIVQGIGWMTMEEVLYNDEGQLLTNALSTCKVPDIHFAPNDIQVHFLENSPNQYGPYQSKAIGEPPLMYGIGAYFAIRNAIKEFKPKNDLPFKAPMTPENVLLSLYNKT